MKLATRRLPLVRPFSIIFLLLVTISPIVARATQQKTTVDAPPTKPDIIVLDGLDPVLLIQGKETPGKPQLSITRGSYVYVFASESTKAEFAKTPERYEIQLEGSCARMGPQVGGNPDLFTVRGGKIYIFGSQPCQTMFEAAPEKFLDVAPVGLGATPEALQKGKVLIDKAVAAIGPAARIDALSTYQEEALATSRTPQGDVQSKFRMLRGYPGQVRREQERPFGLLVDVLTSESGFSVVVSDNSRPARELSLIARQDLGRQLSRSGLEIVRARKQSGFEAAYRGTVKVEGAALEEVDVSINGDRVQLGIDSATARIVQIKYRGRVPSSGEFGEVVLTFSDFQEVDGLTLPFKRSGSVNGVTQPQFDLAIQSIVLDGKLDPSIFGRVAK